MKKTIIFILALLASLIMGFGIYIFIKDSHKFDINWEERTYTYKVYNEKGVKDKYKFGYCKVNSEYINNINYKKLKIALKNANKDWKYSVIDLGNNKMLLFDYSRIEEGVYATYAKDTKMYGADEILGNFVFDNKTGEYYLNIKKDQ